MPVQFTCSHCRRTLSVSRRKVGTPVACPKCGQSTVVPPLPGATTDVHPVPTALADAKGSTDDAPADVSVEVPDAILPAVAGVPAVGFPPASEVGAFDDIPGLIGDAETVAATTNDAAPIEALPPTPPPPPTSDAAAVGDFQLTESITPPMKRLAQTRRGRSPEGKVLLVTRQAVYAQAGLMGGLLIVAFLAGLLVGRGHRVDAPAAPTEKAAAEPVALGGHVLYSLSPGDSLPDEGAVVIALPADKKPDPKIAARGLRADDETDPAAETALGEFGATVARTDARGEFQLVVPRPGNYSLLMISSHAKRPDGVTLPMADGEALSRYFTSPGELIGQHRYTLISRRLAGAPSPLTHEFVPTDKR